MRCSDSQMQGTNQSVYSENIIHNSNIYTSANMFSAKTPNNKRLLLSSEKYQEPENVFFKSKMISAYF